MSFHCLSWFLLFQLILECFDCDKMLWVLFRLTAAVIGCSCFLGVFLNVSLCLSFV